MNPRAAIAIIRDCVESGRYRRFIHFDERLDQRGLFWGDVLAVIDSPARVLADGQDVHGRDRWLIRRKTSYGLRIELVTLLEQDEHGHWTFFVTLYHLD